MKFTFTGCSFTLGEGLELEKADRQNYCNLVGSHYLADVHNLGEKGNSNYNIFMSALNELLYNKPDMVFVQWSGLNRQWLYPGPHTHLIISAEPQSDYTYRDLKLSRSQLQFFADQYQLLNHDYHNTLEMVRYSNVLAKLGNVTFINGLLPWQKDIANLTSLSDPAKCFSKYTKNLLDFDTRDDKELTDFFIKLFEAVSTLDHKLWVNMFDSMYTNIIDTGTDDRHPGPKSHQQYADTIINYLEKK